MKLTNFHRNLDGSASFGLEVDDKEAEELMTFAVNILIDQGIIDTGETRQEDEYEFYPEDDNNTETLQ